MKPEEALERARAAAAARPPQGDEPVSLDASPIDEPSAATLLEWAVIEPDMERVYTTRRLGAPLTFAKRSLIRSVRQYLGDALAQQSRFNLLAAARIVALEERVRELERRLEERG